MRLTTSIAGIVIIALTLSYGCDNTSSGPGDDPGNGRELAVTHDNHGCIWVIDLGVDPGEPDAFLVGYTYDGETLALKIRFSANCCPEFLTDAWAEGNQIHIDVLDVLAGCRCICPYANDFTFPWSSPGDVGISFRSWPVEPRAYPCSFDTVIVLP